VTRTSGFPWRFRLSRRRPERDKLAEILSAIVHAKKWRRSACVDNLAYTLASMRIKPDPVLVFALSARTGPMLAAAWTGAAPDAARTLRRADLQKAATFPSGDHGLNPRDLQNGWA
jgi:hypothetical protein